jgi:choline dehydrogenase-like flavoprotein
LITDSRTLDPGANIETDVCVVGAGPVGLVIARELGKVGRVCVLESGSLDGAQNAHLPLDGEVVGGWYPPLAESRSRGFGGTSTIWVSEVARAALGARYGPLQEVDFDARANVPHSGWPFARTELEPYYERAAQLCEIEPLDDDPKLWEKPLGVAELPLGEGIATRIVRYGFQSVFTRHYVDWATRAENATVYLRARVLRVETDDSGSRATRVLVGSSPDRNFHVTARFFVLALGGIENARLLLLSNSNGAAIGNAHDLVGRFFMDHPTASCRLIPSGPDAVRRLGLYDTLVRGRNVGQGSLGLADEAIRREGLLNSGSFLAPDIDRQMGALGSLGGLRDAVRQRHVRLLLKCGRRMALGGDAIAAAAYRRLVERFPVLEPTTVLWPTTRLLNTLGIGHISGWSRLPFAHRRFRSFGFFHVLEQAPERERRITLSAKRDDFGDPLPRLHWFISDRELDSMRRTQEIFARAFERSGLGRLVKTEELNPSGDVLEHIFPTAHHHLGGTRMHTDPQHGVVDQNSRVHGMRNLFISGTSVFPTGGYVNPTLTAVALAVRLSDHLRGLVNEGPHEGS